VKGPRLAREQRRGLAVERGAYVVGVDDVDVARQSGEPAYGLFTSDRASNALDREDRRRQPHRRERRTRSASSGNDERGPNLPAERRKMTDRAQQADLAA